MRPQITVAHCAASMSPLWLHGYAQSVLLLPAWDCVSIRLHVFLVAIVITNIQLRQCYTRRPVHRPVSSRLAESHFAESQIA